LVYIHPKMADFRQTMQEYANVCVVYARCVGVGVKNEILVTIHGTDIVKILNIASNYVTLTC